MSQLDEAHNGINSGSYFPIWYHSYVEVTRSGTDTNYALATTIAKGILPGYIPIIFHKQAIYIGLKFLKQNVLTTP